jgi:hypothetical protein
MVHVPSLLVGSTFSLVAFLAVHEQLDHRSRLSAKWKVTGEARKRIWVSLEIAMGRTRHLLTLPNCEQKRRRRNFEAS